MRSRANFKQLWQASVLENHGLLEQYNKMARQFDPLIAPTGAQQAYRQMLTALDMAQCSNRYMWDLSPCTNITSQQLESIIYRYPDMCMYEDDGHLAISPFAMVGELNQYGRLTRVIPIDLAGKPHGEYMGIINEDGSKTEPNRRCAVVFSDYTHIYESAFEGSRYAINQFSTIQDQVAVYDQLRTNILLSIKKAIAVCDNEDQRTAILNQVSAILDPTLPIVPMSKRTGKRNKSDPTISDTVEMFNFDNNFDTQNYCQTIDYYEKKRANFNGIPTPDTFEKKERKITSESEFSNVKNDLMLIDGYYQRFNALELAKKYIKVEGIELCSVQINPILDPQSREVDSGNDLL